MPEFSPEIKKSSSTILSILGGWCEWCKESEKPVLAVSFFTEGDDNYGDGPWKKEGFPHFEFVTVICKECLLEIPNIRRHLKNKKAQKVYIEIRTNLRKTIYEQPDWDGVITLEESKIQLIFSNHFVLAWVKV